MTPKFMLWVMLVWSVCLMIDSVVGNVGNAEEGKAIVNSLATGWNFTTTFGIFGFELPIPNDKFFDALRSAVIWDFNFFDGPWIYIRFLFMAISGAIMLGLLIAFLPSIMSGIRGLLSFVPGL